MIGLEFVSPNLRLTVGEDLFPLSVQKRPNLCEFRVMFVLNMIPQRVAPFYRGFLPLFQQHVTPFDRTRTTTTDQQTSLLARSDRLVLGRH